MKAYLALEDGTVYEGSSFGYPSERHGEVIFNTSLCGYQEILTDPSYKGQIVVMTNPLIGNYGINNEDHESAKPMIEGFVVKECSRIVSNWRASESLHDYLKRNHIVGIEGIDTRHLTKHIRDKGSLRGIISTNIQNSEDLIRKAKQSDSLLGKNLVDEVTSSDVWSWNEKSSLENFSFHKNIVVYDFGVKYSILRQLQLCGCNVIVVPAHTSANDVLALKPDGILLSNGPGDPAALPQITEEIKRLLGTVPILAICLGHQIMTQALNGKTYKMKFGHHGGNHPVVNRQTHQVEITAQNHGFCVDESSLNLDEINILYALE